MQLERLEDSDEEVGDKSDSDVEEKEGGNQTRKSKSLPENADAVPRQRRIMDNDYPAVKIYQNALNVKKLM